jgi:hypothetical protein
VTQALLEEFGLDAHGSHIPKAQFDPYQAFRVANSEDWQERHRRKAVAQVQRPMGSQADQVKRALWDNDRGVNARR